MNNSVSARQPEHIEITRQDRPPDVTVAELRKQHLFEHNKSAEWSKKGRHGHVTEFHAFIGVEDENKICFGILPVDRKGQPGFFKADVELSWSNCNLGGKRAWLLCPGRFEEPCGRRVAHLYIDGSYLVCRHCAEVGYISDHGDRNFRWLHRAQQILRRLGGSGSLVESFPPRPRSMHYATYHALCWRVHWYLRQYERANRDMLREAQKALGIEAEDDCEEEDCEEEEDYEEAEVAEADLEGQEEDDGGGEDDGKEE